MLLIERFCIVITQYFILLIKMLKHNVLSLLTTGNDYIYNDVKRFAHPKCYKRCYSPQKIRGGFSCATLVLMFTVIMIATFATTVSAVEIPQDGLIGWFKLDGNLKNEVEGGEKPLGIGNKFGEPFGNLTNTSGIQASMAIAGSLRTMVYVSPLTPAMKDSPIDHLVYEFIKWETFPHTLVRSAGSVIRRKLDRLLGRNS